jgi:hypothetical protein
LKRATILQGTYTADRRTLKYWTRCPACAQFEQCKKRRAPAVGCTTPGWIRLSFADQDHGSVGWSGVITLRKIASAVREYLERDEDALPDDVYVPLRQMRLEEAL